MNRDPKAWARLGQALKQARTAGGLSQADLAQLAGVSTASVQTAEAGSVPKSRMPITLAPIATALGWPPGSIEAVLNGDSPPGWVDVPVQAYVDAELVEGAITNAMVRAIETTTSVEIRNAVKIAMDELRRHGVVPETDGVQP